MDCRVHLHGLTFVGFAGLRVGAGYLARPCPRSSVVKLRPRRTFRPQRLAAGLPRAGEWFGLAGVSGLCVPITSLVYHRPGRLVNTEASCGPVSLPLLTPLV